MKPISLKIQAFGPYAKQEIIDFTQLKNRNMFVITGKTGSGKTTIFDAICFGLYGRASGEDRAATDLRSQFASDEILTEIELVFQLKGKIYKITRSPQQEKKKSRGEGYTTINAKATLVEVSSEEKLLGSNVREVDEKMKDLLQLDVTQFRQIVMIPQGDFRKLLVSDSKEKEQILQRLFDTELYKKLEEKLKERAQTLRDEIADFIKEKESIQLQIKNWMEIDHEESVILHDIENWLGEMKESLINLNGQINEKEMELEVLISKKQKDQQIIALFEELDQLNEKVNQLIEDNQDMELVKTKMKEAIAAEKVKPYDEQVKQIEASVQQLVVKKDKQITKRNETELQLKKANEKIESLIGQKEEREKKKNTLTLIQNSVEDVSDLEKLQERKNGLLLDEKENAKKLELATHKVHVLKNDQQAEEKEISHLIDFLTNSEKVELQLNKEIYRLKELTTVKQLMISNVQLSNELIILEDKLSVETSREKDAYLTYKKVEEKFHLHQAYELSSNLVDGEPCPVCGSEHHPARQEKVSEGSFTREDVKAALVDYENGQKNVRQIEMEIAAQKTKTSTLEERIYETLEDLNLSVNLTINEIETELVNGSMNLETLEKKKNETLRSKKQYAELKEKIAHRKDRLEQGQLFLEETKRKLDVAKTSQQTTQVQISQIEQQLQKKFSYVPTFSQLHQMKEELEEWIVRFDKQYRENENERDSLKERLIMLTNSVHEVELQLEDLSKQLDKSMHQRTVQLTKSGFGNLEEFFESSLSNEEITKLEQRITHFEDVKRTLVERQNWLMNELKHQSKPDLNEIETQIVDQREKLQSVKSMYQEQFSMVQQISRNVEIIRTIDLKIGEKEKKYEVLGNLSDIARGQNSQKLTFERFVLTAFLDEILSIANDRLAPMTNGRYQLVRKQERSKGNVQSGLELLVFDQYTGLERHVKTLSGGESFKASLSLALGLADVVQERSGGVSMETMFIDEGFGTLDPESLDQAIETLLSIQKAGRLVGVISHVSELKERLDAHLIVESDIEGSKARFFIR
ncbi:AAA family ATPase [Mangrovibacillus cuniculi]|uniref:Nuclease SbcCD subunit C n=1 Tax=Mangrovibacillus cuniculi TaxID=2593652 RepID=A0A7S8CAK7_9BACI|nr:AAA family ATPase [Mangrovibacillus cuniculi]QPC46454.1 AAA family ATPase [Mangrovibacillus cuniculi]